MQTARNISKSPRVYINGGFRLLVILPFIITGDLKGERLLWTAMVVLTKVCMFIKEIAKGITLSNNVVT